MFHRWQKALLPAKDPGRDPSAATSAVGLPFSPGYYKTWAELPDGLADPAPTSSARPFPTYV
jgi:hypothetical protein